MKFFIDTADIKEIKEALALGVLEISMTTNLKLVAKTGLPRGTGRDRFRGRCPRRDQQGFSVAASLFRVDGRGSAGSAREAWTTMLETKELYDQELKERARPVEDRGTSG